MGILLGVVLGVVVSKTMDHWVTPVSADGRLGDGRAGKKVASDQAEIFRYAAKTIGPAVVNVTTMQRVILQQGGGIWERPTYKEGVYPRGVGSGFVFDATNGYILTNNHVVAEGESWVVKLSDKREVEAKLIGTDPQTDVAVLKIPAGTLTAAPLGDSDALEVGDWVLAVGNPFGMLEQTVTAGIISAKGRRGFGITNYEDFLQTDAAINMGNSGGPLVNLNGEVVGINTAIFSRSGGYQGVGFTIPINQAKRIAQKLIRGGSVTRGWMGVKVQDLSPDDARKLNLEEGVGASVEGVFLGGPAKQAGLLPGDILVSINGKAVHGSDDIPNAVAEMEPGTVVKLELRRKDIQKTIDLKVGSQPKDWVSKDWPNRGQ